MISVEFSTAVEGVVDCVEASRALVAFDTPPGLSTVTQEVSVSRVAESSIPAWRRTVEFCVLPWMISERGGVEVGEVGRGGSSSRSALPRWL